MNIGAEEKKHIARFLSFLLSGEKIAHRCSAEQARICEDGPTKRFLRTQSRQEKFHAATFQSAILCLTPKGVSNPAKSQLQQYESLLNEATKKHDLYTSIVGLQVVLEGMGEIALSHFDRGIRNRGNGYQKIRSAILSQEDSHHIFGLDFLKTSASSANTTTRTGDYLFLIEDMLTSLHGLFDFFDEDSSNYLSQFHHSLPDQILNHALYRHTSA